jgi:hypothetical protein
LDWERGHGLVQAHLVLGRELAIQHTRPPCDGDRERVEAVAAAAATTAWVVYEKVATRTVASTAGVRTQRGARNETK